jgi:hypothetical protein
MSIAAITRQKAHGKVEGPVINKVAISAPLSAYAVAVMAKIAAPIGRATKPTV